MCLFVEEFLPVILFYVPFITAAHKLIKGFYFDMGFWAQEVQELTGEFGGKEEKEDVRWLMWGLVK